MELLTPVPSGCLFTANSCPFPGFTLQNPLSSTQPPSQQVAQDPGRNVQSCGVDHVCSSYFVLPSTDHSLCSPLIPRRSFSVPDDFPIMREFFLSVGTSPHLQLPARLAGLFYFFFLSSYLVVRGFFLSFRCPKSSADVQQVLYENCSICRCILDVLVGVTNSASSYSTVLTPSLFFFSVKTAMLTSLRCPSTAMCCPSSTRATWTCGPCPSTPRRCIYSRGVAQSLWGH